MKGQKPDWRVSSVVSEILEDGTKKDRWTNLGVAFNGKDTITLFVDAWPLNGKVILQKPQEKPKPQFQ